MWWYLQMLTIGIGTVVLEAFLDGYKPKCKHCRQPWGIILTTDAQ